MSKKIKSLQNRLLEFLEDESDTDGKYEYFVNLLSIHKLINCQYEIKALLRLISSIGKNYNRIPNFICKFERLLRHFKQDLKKKKNSNSEVFKIFVNNKKISISY